MLVGLMILGLTSCAVGADPDGTPRLIGGDTAAGNPADAAATRDAAGGASLCDDPVVWYADCDGDAVASSTSVPGCGSDTTGLASPCTDGMTPDGGFIPFAGSDCDDEEASVSERHDWYADCDGDGIPSASPTRACGLLGAIAAFKCKDGLGPDGGFWSKVGNDCDDELSGSACGTPTSCLEILRRDALATDGDYPIDPDGTGPGASLSVRCDMAGGGWTVIAREDFSNGGSAGFHGLSDVPTPVDTSSTCAQHYGAMLGGVNILGGPGADTRRAFALLGVPHTEISVALDYMVIDSWDGEAALVYIDDVELYRASLTQSDATVNTCGGTWPDLGAQPVTLRVPHTLAAMVLRITSTLDQEASDESFGVDNVVVRVR